MKRQLLSEEDLKMKGPYEMAPSFITIHEVHSGLGAKSVADYLHRSRGVEGYHILIDDKETIQIVPLNKNTWHAGDGSKGQGNCHSIAIGICRAFDYKTNRYEVAIKQTIKVVENLMREFDISIENVVQHNYWTNEDCPRRMRKENKWEQFKLRINKKGENKLWEKQ